MKYGNVVGLSITLSTGGSLSHDAQGTYCIRQVQSRSPRKSQPEWLGSIARKNRRERPRPCFPTIPYSPPPTTGKWRSGSHDWHSSFWKAFLLTIFWVKICSGHMEKQYTIGQTRWPSTPASLSNSVIKNFLMPGSKYLECSIFCTGKKVKRWKSSTRKKGWIKLLQWGNSGSSFWSNSSPGCDFRWTETARWV